MNAMTRLLCVLIFAGGAPAEPRYEQEYVFPPEPMHNHSASIVETPDGHLLACWFHGRGEKTDDTLVICGAWKRKGDEGWMPPFVMADNQDLPDQNPVLFIDPNRRLWLFWISSLDNSRRAYLLKYRWATEYSPGASPRWAWQDVLHCRPRNLEPRFLAFAPSAPVPYGARFESDPKYRDRLELAEELVQDKLWRRLGWMPRCQPIMLSETRMMIGLYSDIFLCSLAAFTEDAGRSWEFSEPILGYGAIQPSLSRRQNGDIVAYMRDKSPARRIRVAESQDEGITWSPVKELDIANPDSSVSCAVLASGHWLLVCNDVNGVKRGGRTRLTAFLSDDEGRTWQWRRRLEDLDSTCTAAYPTVIQTSDGLVHCVYTYTPKPEETIKHVWFDEAWVQQSPS
jgi:predicted neuraminidase